MLRQDSRKSLYPFERVGEAELEGATVALERLGRAVARLEAAARKPAGGETADLAALRAEHAALQAAAARVAQRLDTAITGLAVALRDSS